MKGATGLLSPETVNTVRDLSEQKHDEPQLIAMKAITFKYPGSDEFRNARTNLGTQIILPATAHKLNPKPVSYEKSHSIIHTNDGVALVTMAQLTSTCKASKLYYLLVCPPVILSGPPKITDWPSIAVGLQKGVVIVVPKDQWIPQLRT